jgi:hypothetical protein
MTVIFVVTAMKTSKLKQYKRFSNTEMGREKGNRMCQ